MNDPAARVFAQLADNPGRAQSIESLCATGWPDKDPRRAKGSLRMAILRMRAHLADSNAAIATVPDYGYAWVEVRHNNIDERG